MTRIIAKYDVESPMGLAHAADVLAGEQSTGTFVRLAAETDELRERSGARVEGVKLIQVSKQPALPTRHKADRYERGIITVSWPFDTIGPSLPNLLATVAGNLFELAEISAIRLLDIKFPQDFLTGCPGPKFGISGTRKLAGKQQGPLIGTIIKPSVGLSAAETAELTKQLALAGIDFVKDDELQANGPACPLSDRVRAVTRVLNDHADRTGKKVMYAFNITDEIEAMWRHAELLHSAGADCAMVSMHPVGLAGLRALRDRCDLPIHAHRNGWGLFSRSPDIGISYVGWQKLWRLAGADHLHVNGLANKFTEPDAVVAESARAVQEPLSEVPECAHTAMPVFSSGQTVWQMGPSHDLLGNDDFIYCAGGGIMSHPSGPKAGVVALRQAAEAARTGVSVEAHSATAPELAKALKAFKKPEIQSV
jgi:ribulose-bisphosphate carboxylase large chain